MHDGILVGIGTALNDNPQLNTRHLPSRDANPSENGHNNPYHLPRPIILDTNLRLSPNCKLLQNYVEGIGRRPWVICSEPKQTDKNAEWLNKQKTLENAGASVIVLETGQDGYLPIPSVLEALRKHGIRSLMVEGGAQVIRSFSTQSVTKALVDTIIVTIAPTFVGDGAVSYDPGLTDSDNLVPEFKHFSTELFGRDIVVALVPATQVLRE